MLTNHSVRAVRRVIQTPKLAEPSSFVPDQSCTEVKLHLHSCLFMSCGLHIYVQMLLVPMLATAMARVVGVGSFNIAASTFHLEAVADPMEELARNENSLYNRQSIFVSCIIFFWSQNARRRLSSFRHLAFPRRQNKNADRASKKKRAPSRLGRENY